MSHPKQPNSPPNNTPDPSTDAPQRWLDSMLVYLDPRAITMLFLGISAGLPILLIFSSLSLWLREAGVERSAVTYFSWAALGYSFKFIWAPLVDVLPVPVLNNHLGRRRSWLLLSQFLVIGSITAMACVDPANSKHALTLMAIAAVALGFSSATQDIVIDAFRIESAPDSLQAALSATYIAGYRVGMIIAGAGALFLAQHLGSTSEQYNYTAWQWTYLAMAACMSIGIVTTLLRPEPKAQAERYNQETTKDYVTFFLLFCVMMLAFIGTFLVSNPYVADLMAQEGYKQSALIKASVRGNQLFFAFLAAGAVAFLGVQTGLAKREMVIRSYIHPILNFFQRYDTKAACLLLALIGIYRISDIVLGVIANVFYQDIGFSKQQIAGVVKTYGLIMTLIGGFLGGIMVKRFGLMKMLFLGALLSAATNLMFMFMAYINEADIQLLYWVISIDNLAAGLATAAFVAFLSSLTDISFTAIQYAIFSSLMTLIPKTLGGYSGTMVDSVGYMDFFLITTLIGIPVLWVVWLCRRFDLKPKIE